MSDGWAVLVTMKVMGGGTSKQLYYAAIANRVEAVEAVKRRTGATPDVNVEAQAPVSESVFRAHNVADGQVVQW
jgi:hypothetical protein